MGFQYSPTVYFPNLFYEIQNIRYLFPPAANAAKPKPFFFGKNVESFEFGFVINQNVQNYLTIFLKCTIFFIFISAEASLFQFFGKFQIKKIQLNGKK